MTKLIIYESAPSYNTNDTLPIANFYANPHDTSLYKKESIVGNFTKVKEILVTDYDYLNDADRSLHYLIFDSQRLRSVALGCYMEVTDTLGHIRTFGNLNEIAVIGTDTTQLYSLKLLAREESYYRPSQITWQLMWRNCYPLPIGSTLENMEIKIFKGLEGRENTSWIVEYQFDSSDSLSTNYLELLGLDNYDNLTGTNIPDGKIEESRFIIKLRIKLIVFPSRKPFDNTVRYSIEDRVFPELEVKIPELYEYTS